MMSCQDLTQQTSILPIWFSSFIPSFSFSSLLCLSLSFGCSILLESPSQGAVNCTTLSRCIDRSLGMFLDTLGFLPPIPNRHIKSKQLPSPLKYLCNWSPSLHLCLNHPNQAIFLQQKHCNNYSLKQASWQGRRHWNSSGKVSSNKDYAVTLLFSSHKPTMWSFHDIDPMCTYFKVSVCMLSCTTLCDPTDWSLPGFSVHGILQTRTLEWVAMTSTRESSWPRDQVHVSYVSCIGRWVL